MSDPTSTTPTESLRLLVDSLIDYAGLFPPSKLPMEEAVTNYASYRASDDAWMLGRFIVPVARLDEFEHAAEARLPREHDDEPWPVSAIVGDDADADIERIFAFNRVHAEDHRNGLAVIDAIELRRDDPFEIDRLMKLIPEQLTPYFELPASGENRPAITALAGTGGRAKIRCGGVTPDLFPSVEDVARFIVRCSAADVPFKATAGLHHPVRAEHALTYEDDAPRGVMHGFLNVFLCAAFVRAARLDEQQATDILRVTDAGDFRFGPDGVRWGDKSLDNTRIAGVRESFAIGYGSCSFTEPTADLRTLGLL
ncbi:MAG: hypothetical protein Tsb0013_17850 [Phycisphaerales bacterium]